MNVFKIKEKTTRLLISTSATTIFLPRNPLSRTNTAHTNKIRHVVQWKYTVWTLTPTTSHFLPFITVCGSVTWGSAVIWFIFIRDSNSVDSSTNKSMFSRTCFIPAETLRLPVLSSPDSSMRFGIGISFSN